VRRHLARKLFTAVTLTFVISTTLPGQQPKELHGHVRDPLGALVAGASVDLLAEGKVVGHATSGPDGTFHLPLPHAGLYSLRVSAPSFQAATTPAAYFSGPSRAAIEVTLATSTLTQQVTVTATGVAVPEAQIGASITVLPPVDDLLTPEVQDDLRLVPGLQVTQVGQIGGSSGLNIRGGSTDANKVLVDGVPANAIGGAVEFANIASVGIDSIEVLREPNSALYGSDALAGVVNLTSARGTTPLPLFTYAGDAGNFHTYRNEVTAGTLLHHFDLYSAFARSNTDNNLPNSAFHNATYAGNFGWTPDPANELRFTVRHLAQSEGQPNATALYGIPDDGQEKEQDDYYSAAWNSQTRANWHNQVRYGGLRQNSAFNDFGPVGIPDGFGDTDGALVKLTGANGYSVQGQALFYYAGSAPYSDPSQTKRDFVYAQTDYRPTAHLLALGAFKYEREYGVADYGTPIQRGNYSYTVQLAGDLHRRLFYNAGTGLEDNGLFGFAATPRASLAYYLARPAGTGVFSGTKLHGSFGKGIKEPSVFQQNYSLYTELTQLPASTGVPSGAQVIGQYHITQVGAENARTFDGGLEQQLDGGRVRLGVTYFHNEFTNAVEYVPSQGILQLLGISAGNPYATTINKSYGGYINSLAFRSQGIEFESEYRLGGHLLARAGYTYTDPVVQHSFSSDSLSPSYNTSFNFSTVPIGAYSPLKGARPFRITPHAGYFGLNYTQGRFNAALTGSLVGRRDDSTFLTDSNFGNSLLLPNRNLDGGYERLDLGTSYQATARLSVYANVQNLLSEHYFEAFGYPSLPLTLRAGVKLNFGGHSWRFD
jgi:iron complex outermembrane receptor protein/vitamin B12 transporter